MKLGTNLQTRQDFIVNIPELLQSHAFVTGITRTGKTNTCLKLIEGTRSEEFVAIYGRIPIVIFDIDNEYKNVHESLNDFVTLSNSGKLAEYLSVDRAEDFGRFVRRDSISVVIRLKDIPSKQDREIFVRNFLQGFRTDDTTLWHPNIILIDEADLLVPTTNKQKNSHSRDEIIDCAKRGLKEGISLFIATQTSSSVHIDVRRQCHNQLMGGQVERSDRRISAEMLDNPELFKSLYDLEKGQFYVRGKALAKTAVLIQVDETTIKPQHIATEEPEQTAEVFEENIKDRLEGIDVSLKESYEEKIERLEDEIKILKTNQFTDERRKATYDIGYNDGIWKMQEQQKTEKKKRWF